MEEKKTRTRKAPTAKNAKHTSHVLNDRQKAIVNSLQDVLGFMPASGTSPLSQTNTLFYNNRYYMVSNMRQLLSEIYVEHGLVQTLIDVPVDDAFRGGIKIKSKQLSTAQIQELEAIIDKEAILETIAQARKWTRLYGGGGVMILTDQDAESPLDIEAITRDSPLEIRAVDMWELFWDKQAAEGFNPALQVPNMDYYSYYGMTVHASRVLKQVGRQAPSFLRPRFRGWGVSEVEALVRSINQYLKNNDLTFEVLDEFRVDIYKIKNLTQSLVSGAGTDAIRRRVEMANQQKNFQHAITMDAEDDFLQKQLTFSGIAEILKEIRMQIACDMRMPITKIFGVSSTGSGLNSTQDDLENYNAMIEGTIRQKSKYDIIKILEIYCQKFFGFIPDDLQIEFAPLRIMTATDEETVKTQKFTRALQAQQSGLISADEFREICNRENLLNVQLERAAPDFNFEIEAKSNPGTDDNNQVQTQQVLGEPPV